MTDSTTPPMDGNITGDPTENLPPLVDADVDQEITPNDIREASDMTMKDDDLPGSSSSTPPRSPRSQPRRPSTATASVRSRDLAADAVGVYCRVRPENYMEKTNDGKPCVEFGLTDSEKHPEEMIFRNHGVDDNVYKFPFRRVFRPSHNQQDIYDEIGLPVVNTLLSGVNCALLGYGQTSSGKTYTMEGPNLEDPYLQGLMPRICAELFRHIDAAPRHIQFRVFASNVEVYKERIYDLLSDKKSPLRPREDVSRGLWLPSAEVVTVKNYRDIFKVMKRGSRNRSTAETAMNILSSRSHSLFLVTLAQTDTVMQLSKVSQLYMVDLAGSERVAKTHVQGERLDEAKKINTSLLSLQNVISKLNDAKSKHIPYRDSKLTLILRNAFGGNSRTSLIVNVSESTFNAGESISTCRFGQRAQNVKNKPRVNQERSVAQLTRLLKEAEKTVRAQSDVIKKLTEDLQQYKEMVSLMTPMELEDPKEDDTLALIRMQQERQRTEIREAKEQAAKERQDSATTSSDRQPLPMLEKAGASTSYGRVGTAAYLDGSDNTELSEVPDRDTTRTPPCVTPPPAILVSEPSQILEMSKGKEPAELRHPLSTLGLSDSRSRADSQDSYDEGYMSTASTASTATRSGLSEDDRSLSPALPLRLSEESHEKLQQMKKETVALQRSVDELTWTNSIFRENLVQVPNEFLCPVWRTLLVDPVVAADGHTYEREAINEWLRHSSISPMSGKSLTRTTLTPNYTIRSLIQANPLLRMYLEKNRLQQNLEMKTDGGPIDPAERARVRREKQREDLQNVVKMGGVYLFCATKGQDEQLRKANAQQKKTPGSKKGVVMGIDDLI